MKKTNLTFILLLSILFTVVTVGSSIEAAPTPSSIHKFSRCADRAGSTFTPVADTGNGKGEKCCYPRNKETGLKTCIKCTYPGGGDKAVCTKNQFRQSDKFKNPVISGGAPSQLAPPKPLTRFEKLKRGRLNPGRAPSQLAPPEAPATTPAQRARDRFMGRQGFAPMAR
jgi:hypothetical protein